ncbi:MAG: hypothetical protein LBQ86_03275 [Holophagales bacterium]|nr:hypothetical protein [Holophagales bacterium]
MKNLAILLLAIAFAIPVVAQEDVKPAKQECQTCAHCEGKKEECDQAKEAPACAHCEGKKGECDQVKEAPACAHCKDKKGECDRAKMECAGDCGHDHAKKDEMKKCDEDKKDNKENKDQ